MPCVSILWPNPNTRTPPYGPQWSVNLEEVHVVFKSAGYKHAKISKPRQCMLPSTKKMRKYCKSLDNQHRGFCRRFSDLEKMDKSHQVVSCPLSQDPETAPPDLNWNWSISRPTLPWRRSETEWLRLHLTKPRFPTSGRWHRRRRRYLALDLCVSRHSGSWISTKPFTDPS